MHCTRCKQEIPEHLDTCPVCQNSAQIECQKCHAGMPAEAVFCAQCGTKLDKTPPNSFQENLDLPTQRRHLTVMFCDLVGSTGISTRLDPEDLSDLLVEYRNLCKKIIKKWDGYLADFQGDGIMVYFGYPTAHEDDSLRAVYAGLQIIDEISNNKLESHSHQIDLAVRIGINSGRAVIGNIGAGDIAQDMGIVGETPNVAAKLQAKSDDNVIVISDSTYGYVKGFFKTEFLGTQQIKGVDKKVGAYRVLAALEQAERFEGKRFVGLNPLTGRDNEIDLLKDNWSLTGTGKFVSMVIVGEAGIGKSRLLWSFRQWLKSSKHSTIVFNCSAYHTQTALYPFIEILSRGGFGDKQKSKKRLITLFKKIVCYEHPELESTAELLVDFIYERKIDNDPEKYKNRIFDIFLSMAKSMSNQAPLLIIVEDLHWIDPTSKEFLLRFLNSNELSNICLVTTSREKSDLDLPVDLPLELAPLDHEQSAELVGGIISNTDLPEFLLNRLIDSCNGNPLYLEESARYLLDSDILEKDYSKQQLHLISQSKSFAPGSLHDLFMSRLDKLSNEKWLAQLACAIGRQFKLNILKAVAQIDEGLLQKTLNRLVRADIICPVDGINPQLFEFKHVLLRDATHDALLRTQRQFIHQKIIDAYRQQQPDLLEQQPELLAYHHTQAGNTSRAVKAWQKAGIKAQRLSANIEAVSHFRNALNMIEKSKHSALKLELLIQMGPSLMAVESWASEEVKAVYNRCVELSQKTKNDRQLFASLRGLWGNVFLRGDLNSASKISKQLAHLAKRTNSNELLIEAILSQAMEGFWLGNFVESLNFINQVTDIYDQNIHKEHAYIFSVDPGVVSLFYASRNLWYLGYPDQALRNVKASIELAENQQHYPSLTWGLGFYSAVHIARGEYVPALEISTRGVELSQKHDFPLWEAWGHVLSGCCQIFIDKTQHGLAQIEHGIQLYKKLGAGVALPYFYSLQTESLLVLQQPDKCLRVTNQAIEFAQRHSINSSMADLLLLKSRILHAQSSDNYEQAMHLCNQALSIARSQRANSSILKILLFKTQMHEFCDRASLAALDQIYKSFKEGRDLNELCHAKKILSESGKMLE